MVENLHTEARPRWAEALPLLALGMIAGVSFLAQPAKFLTPELSLAQLVSVGSTLFGVSHGYQGIVSCARITLYGVLFGLLALWRRSLRPGMIAHAMTDVLAGVFRI